MAIKDDHARGAVYRNTNGVPRTLGGATTHLVALPGQVANRILSVGSKSRAKKIAENFDQYEDALTLKGARGFTIHTGKFNGVLVSIIATGMGTANMDFVVRESKDITRGKSVIVRYGTCGSISKDLEIGSIAVCGKGSIFVTRNPDAFGEDADQEEPPYRISKLILPNKALTENIKNSLTTALKGKCPVVDAMNATTCSFYSSQGRNDGNFDDRNNEVMAQIQSKYPEVSTLEMETFHLLDLARCSYGEVHATSAVIVVANRYTKNVLTYPKLHELERAGGRAILESLVAYNLD